MISANEPIITNQNSNPNISWDEISRSIANDRELSNAEKSRFMACLPIARATIGYEPKTIREMFAECGRTLVRGDGESMDSIRFLRFLDYVSGTFKVIIGGYRPNSGGVVEFRAIRPNEQWSEREIRHRESDRPENTQTTLPNPFNAEAPKKLVEMDWDWCVKAIKNSGDLFNSDKEWYPKVIEKVKGVLTGEFMYVADIYDKSGMDALRPDGMKVLLVRDYVRKCLDWICNNTHRMEGTCHGTKAAYRILYVGDVWHPRPIVHRKKHRKTVRRKSAGIPVCTTANGDATIIEPKPVEVRGPFDGAKKKDTFRLVIASWGYTIDSLIDIIYLHEKELREWAPLPPEVKVMVDKGFTREEAFKLYDSIRAKQ